MSPTIFRSQGFRFLFFSREESRMHCHVQGIRGEAKFWMEPEIQLALNHGLTTKDIRIAQNLIQEHRDEIENAWHRHFGN